MVAIESQAAGAPVVAFDVGPLREVAGGGGARLVSPYDLDAFASETADLVESPDEANRLRQLGRAWARRYEWNQLARRQEAHYARTLERSGGRPLVPAGSDAP
jgi:glycosyltransferase involved in cell wall biosynthesis